MSQRFRNFTAGQVSSQKFAQQGAAREVSARPLSPSKVGDARA
jgi:hypothetical protein